MFSDYFGHYLSPINVVFWIGIYYFAPTLALCWLGLSLVFNAYRWFNND